MSFILLGWSGGKPLEAPYMHICQLTTIYYFVFLIVLIPLLNYVDAFYFNKAIQQLKKDKLMEGNFTEGQDNQSLLNEKDKLQISWTNQLVLNAVIKTSDEKWEDFLGISSLEEEEDLAEHFMDTEDLELLSEDEREQEILAKFAQVRKAIVEYSK